MTKNDSPERYRHTQVGTLIIVTMIVAVLFCVGLGLGLMGEDRVGSIVGWSVAGILLVAGVLFWSMTVIVHDGDVVIRFGPGLLHFRYRLTEFVSASAVRNRWWYGFGIHMGFKSILYNVSGLDAVELVKRDGRCVRIGTDEPKALEQALRAAIAAANINTPESWQELHDSEEQP